MSFLCVLIGSLRYIEHFEYLYVSGRFILDCVIEF